MLSFGLRNLKVYFREKTSVFFSLLSVLIIIMIYVLFLGDIVASDLGDMPGAKTLMASWLISGILAVTSITTTMGAFEAMVTDKANNIYRDFLSSPIKRYKLVGGYAIGAFTVGIVMSVVAFVLGEVYIMSTGGSLPDLLTILKILGIIALSSVSSSAFVFFLVSFFSSTAAFATASTVLGTLIGFIAGVYMPIGNFPAVVQGIIKCVPVSHAAALFRGLMLEKPLAVSFAGVPESFLTEFREMMGLDFKYGSFEAPATLHILVLAGSALLFFGLAIWNVSRKKK